jgi:hypothetical protein
LVDAAIKRQDDLRESEATHVREILRLREKLYSEETTRVEAIARLRAEHQAELREQEAKRIDSIRAVDVEAVQRAAEVQATQQGVLATQVVTSAEALRTQVAAAAQAAQIALAAALEPLQKDIADLRKSQYEAQGQKTQVVERQAGTASVGVVVAGIVGGLALMVAIIGAVIAIVANGGQP